MKKQFKTESKKLMELMINSIYTNKEIFLREIVSNASDALDKLNYMSLTDTSIKMDNPSIELLPDKENRTLTIRDNGIGMNKEELENNLGTIAQSGSSLFKKENEKKENIDIIGQFGVGFYSAFMVSKEVTVISKKYGSDEAYTWNSKGIDGYTIEKSEKESYGTDVILSLKEDTEEENYSEYLEEYTLKHLIKKYSDYITYKIKMNCVHNHKKEDSDEYEEVIEEDVLNSLTPIWKREKSKIKDEEYNTFFQDKFNIYENPTKIIHFNAEGLVNFTALLFIPSQAPYNFYTKEYKKGLELYSNGVLIMENCEDLLPDYYGFVKGIIDSPDLSLNISRENLQQDHMLKKIAKSIENKINRELNDFLKNDRENYEKFFENFGLQLKAGICNNFGMDKDKLEDLIIFKSSNEKKYTTFSEYIERMDEKQEKIYYACADTVEKADMLPQTEILKDKGYEILYLTEYGDEIVLQTMMNYKEKPFANVSDVANDITSEDEKKELEKANKDSKKIFNIMKEAIGEVKDVKFTNTLKNHPVCLSSEGEISIQMEKLMKAMPTDNNVKADIILEINKNHPIASKIKKLYKEDKEELKKLSKILYAQGRLIEGLSIDNPTELSNLICDELSK
ncbi:MAG: molecular chaperone HtpG [Bacilli bacterium]|nr:molecular chaperone HtpG [Bacilli bacterium]